MNNKWNVELEKKPIGRQVAPFAHGILRQGDTCWQKCP